MKLKLGERWDHNGTYMEGLGFRYQDHKIVIELAADGNMHGVPLASLLPAIINHLEKLARAPRLMFIRYTHLRTRPQSLAVADSHIARCRTFLSH